MKAFLHYLFNEKLGFFLVNMSAIVVSLFTIFSLNTNLVNIKGEISLSTLLLLVINSLFLAIKTTLNIFSIIVKFKFHTTEEEKISERVKMFKELLEKEDFRL